MLTRYIADLLHIDRKMNLFLLAFFSCSGVLLGVTTAYSSYFYSFSLMRMVADSHVSIVGLVLVVLFPFLITAIAFYLLKPYLFFPAAFLKSFSYTFLMSCISIEFLSAGWLVGFLLLFSDTVVIISLYRYWIRHINGFRSSAIADLVSSIAVSLTACIIDYLWVSPFIVTLMNE